MGLAGGVLVSRADRIHRAAASRRVAAGAPTGTAGAGRCRRRRLLALGISTLLADVQPASAPGSMGLAALGLLRGAGAALFGFVRWEQRYRQPIVKLEFFRSGGLCRRQSRQCRDISDELFGDVVRARIISSAMPSFRCRSPAGSWRCLFSATSSPLHWPDRSSSGSPQIASPPSEASSAVPAWRWSGAGGPAAPDMRHASRCPDAAGFWRRSFQVAYMDIVMRTLPRHIAGLPGASPC